MSKDTKEELLKNSFFRLEAFIEFYLDEERNFTVDILTLINLIDSRIPNLSWEKKDWEEVLIKVNPTLKNIILLLENDEFRVIAFGKGNFKKIGFLLDSPKIFFVDEIGTYQNLLDACKEGKIKILKYMYEVVGCDPTIFQNFTIRMASRNGRLEVVKYLYEVAGCDPTDCDNLAIKMASSNGHLEVIKYLVEKAGCNPRTEDKKSITWAITWNHLEVVKYLKSIGC